MRLFKSREQKEQIDAGRGEWDQFVATASTGDPATVRSALARLNSSPNVLALSDKDRRQRADQAFRLYAENVLADDVLTAEEEAVFDDVFEGLGLTPADMGGRFKDVARRLMIAQANDGRLTPIDGPNLMAKRGEEVFLEVPAGLMKEVVQREWRAGSGGVSFRVMKGVHYRTGRTRGRSVVVGTQIVVEDSGYLAVTSQRAVYVGSRKSLEFAYPKMLDMEVFTDGIRFQVSNRQKSSMLALDEGSGDVVAATINAAAQRL